MSTTNPAVGPYDEGDLDGGNSATARPRLLTLSFLLNANSCGSIFSILQTTKVTMRTGTATMSGCGTGEDDVDGDERESRRNDDESHDGKRMNIMVMMMVIMPMMLAMRVIIWLQ